LYLKKKKLTIVSLDKTLIHRLESFKAPFEQFAVCTETVFWTLNRLVPTEVHYMKKNPGMFSSKTLISFRLKRERYGYLIWHGGE